MIKGNNRQLNGVALVVVCVITGIALWGAFSATMSWLILSGTISERSAQYIAVFVQGCITCAITTTAYCVRKGRVVAFLVLPAVYAALQTSVVMLLGSASLSGTVKSIGIIVIGAVISLVCCSKIKIGNRKVKRYRNHYR